MDLQLSWNHVWQSSFHRPTKDKQSWNTNNASQNNPGHLITKPSQFGGPRSEEIKELLYQRLYLAIVAKIPNVARDSAQRGRMVSVLHRQFGCLGFESRSDHYLDLFLGSPGFKPSATLVNSQLVCLRPVGILNNVKFNLKYLFQCLLGPTSMSAINTADGK